MNLTCTQIAKAAGLRFDRKSGNQIIYYCPNHDDTNGSLNLHIDRNVWMCGPCGKNGGAWAFAFFLSGCTAKNEVIQWLVERNLVEENRVIKTKPVGVYTYKDLDGKEFYQVRKYIATTGKKSYAQFHKDGGEWKPGVDGITLLPYRIDEWKDKMVVYIVEGEKDADNLWKWGIPATTNPQGAGSWREEFNQYFKHKRVVIFPDNDEVGRRHAQEVMAHLIKIAVSVKVVTLPELPPKGDFSDWVSKCRGTKDKMIECVRGTKWSTLSDAGATDDSSEEAKILIRRISYDISDLFTKATDDKADFDRIWMWMKDHDDLWTRIKDAEDRLNESCAAKDPPDIILARCMEWKLSFKNAIIAFLEWNKENK